MVREKEDQASRLRNIRQKLDLTQREMANRIKISAPSYSELETGKYKPNFEVISKIASELNVNLYYIVFGKGEMFIDPANPHFHSPGNYLVNDEEVRRFFLYFEHSPLVQLLILAHFRTILQSEGKSIEQEMSERLEKNE